jgi:hypothetical protein
MRAHEIIRGILDLIDSIDGTKDLQMKSDLEACVVEPEMPADAEINRFKQIAGLLDVLPDNAEFQNEPKEVYLGIAAVTTDAGGGINGPKHPNDLRVKDPSIYPDQQRF